VILDLVERIGVLGGESSGKTELCRALASRLGTEWIREYTGASAGSRRDASFRDAQHPAYLERLSRSRVPWLLAGGDVDARVEAVASWLA